MTQLKTKSGIEVFDAVVETTGVTLHKEDGKVVAKIDGIAVGVVRVTQVKAKGKDVKVSDLIANIDVTKLIGKDPLTLTHEELIALTIHLQSGAVQTVEADDIEDDEEEIVAAAPKVKTKGNKKPAPAPVVEEEEEDDEDEEEEAFELPEGLDTYEAIAALGVKAMWAEIGKHIAAEAGIKARTPKDEMLEAIAEYFELEPLEEDEEEEEVKPKAKAKGKSKPAPVEEEEEDEDDEEFEDEDDIDEDEFDDEEEDEDDIDEDEEDDFDEDEDEDDEEFEDEDEDEDDEDEEDDEEVTEEDVDALFEAGNKQAIVAFCARHDISLPKKKMNANTIKQIIKDALFGEE